MHRRTSQGCLLPPPRPPWKAAPRQRKWKNTPGIREGGQRRRAPRGSPGGCAALRGAATAEGWLPSAPERAVWEEEEETSLLLQTNKSSEIPFFHQTASKRPAPSDPSCPSPSFYHVPLQFLGLLARPTPLQLAS